MTKEERDYLFADVSARLPYSPIFDYGDDDGKVFKLGVINYEFLAHMYFQNVNNKDADMLRPYLRPMSSMTKEECEECMPLFDVMDDNYIPHEEWSYRAFDWLNAHHFDYRGLIEKGLALEAPEGIYEVKGGSVCPS